MHILLLGLVCSLSVLLTTFQLTIFLLSEQDSGSVLVSNPMSEEEREDTETSEFLEQLEFIVPEAEAVVIDRSKSMAHHPDQRAFEYLMDEVSSPPPEA